MLCALVVVSDEVSSNPLTVPPSPDLQALKHQQAAEKTTARSGEGKLLRKARELREKEKINRRVNTPHLGTTARINKEVCLDLFFRCLPCMIPVWFI